VANDRIDGVPFIRPPRRWDVKVIDIEGVGPAYAGKLHEVRIDTTEELLEAGRTPGGRVRLSETTGISSGMLLQWINHADLMRIKGVGSEYADLLEAAGVDTVVELAHRKPENLVTTMRERNDKDELVRRVPSDTMVADWVAQAKKLGRTIEY
jgi:predicted flap endonuclease-1-like 5' DNA nuclease